MSSPVDQSHFQQLVERNHGRFAAIARSYADREADDLLQEILLQVWRCLGSFQGEAAVDTWCYRVALNTAVSWQRHVGRRRKRLPATNDDVQLVARSDEGMNGPQLLHQFLRTLSDSDRAVLLMYMEDLTGAEMAEVLGVSHGAVRVRIHRIKQRLRDWHRGDT